MKCSTVEPNLKDNASLATAGTNWSGINVITRNVQLSGYRPEDLVWLELSLIPEVERVFVDTREGAYHVLTVVDENSQETRNRIYQRELAVVESLPTIDFDFHILARVGHDLAELIDQADRPAYTRR